MKNILVPVGSSENVVSHLQYAVDFAEAVGAKLYVVQVYNVFAKAGTMKNIDAIIEKESKEFLNDLVSKVDTKGVNIVVKTLKGKLVETIEAACKAANADLILIEPRTNSLRSEVFLGKTSGKIIKQTQIPALIVPEGYLFKPVENILMAVKSAILKKEGVLSPLKSIKDDFKANIKLLLVKTPYYKEDDFDVNDELNSLVDGTVVKTENATTFQGVLEHYQSNNPDMLCVIRRRRGFFVKKWEKTTILKRDLQSVIPVLVLRGAK